MERGTVWEPSIFRMVKNGWVSSEKMLHGTSTGSTETGILLQSGGMELKLDETRESENTLRQELYNSCL